MNPFKRSPWQILRHLLRLLQRRPRLGDVFAESSDGPRRRFHRHVLDQAHVASIQLLDRIYQVINIGYGGLRIAVSDEHSFRRAAGERQIFDISLKIMGFPYDLRARLVTCEQGAASFTFEDLTNVDEAFLAGFLYFMDAGIGLKAIPKHSISPHYRGPSWLSYGGLSGAIEVHLRLDDGGEISEAHVFYLYGFRQDFAMFSAKSVSVASKPPRSLQGRDKREILMHSLSILIGLRQVGRSSKLDPIVQMGLQRLQPPARAA